MVRLTYTLTIQREVITSRSPTLSYDPYEGPSTRARVCVDVCYNIIILLYFDLAASMHEKIFGLGDQYLIMCRIEYKYLISV